MQYFKADNPEHQQLADAYNAGTYHQLPQNQVLSHYQSFVQQTPPQEVEAVQHDYFSQMPQVERMGLFSGLMGALGQQQGFNPQQAGVRTTDPSQASPTDLGNLFNFARNSGMLGGLTGGGGNQQPSQGGLGGMIGNLIGGNQSRQPDYNQGSNQPNNNYNRPPAQQQGPDLQNILSNPFAQAAISGLVGFAANRMINGFTNRGQSQAPAQSQPADQNWSQPQAYQNDPGDGSALPGFENPQRSV